MTGKTLAHYEITGLFGKGGMGEVYRARDTTLDRDVALKVLPPTWPPIPPHELGRIIAQCLEKKPAERYQSVASVREDLRGLRTAVESRVSGIGESGKSAPRVLSIGDSLGKFVCDECRCCSGEHAFQWRNNENSHRDVEGDGRIGR